MSVENSDTTGLRVEGWGTPVARRTEESGPRADEEEDHQRKSMSLIIPEEQGVVG